MLRSKLDRTCTVLVAPIKLAKENVFRIRNVSLYYNTFVLRTQFDYISNIKMSLIELNDCDDEMSKIHFCLYDFTSPHIQRI